MARLSPRDLGQALDFLREAEDVGGPDPFPVQLLDRLRDLVHADTVSWHEWSIDGRHHHAVISTSRPEETAAVWDAYPRYRRQDPLPGGCPGAGPPSPALIGRALKFSDFLSLREFRQLELHAFVCRPLGIDFVMKLFLPSHNGVARSLVFDRGRRDFSERDRLVVDVLRPHLIALHDAARTRRVLAALEGHEESAGSLVVLGRNGVIEFAEPRARALLHSYFGAAGGHLPEVVQDWLQEDAARLSVDGRLPPPGAPLTVVREGRRLALHRVRDALLLREDVAILTPREREVLALVADGSSNAEVAARLWLSVGTVRVHLNHIYAKLGVTNRTAAVAQLRQSGPGS
jgi:DNA-binding CsgD family transcriptional regulator